jgi:hypothetical protein
MNAQATNPAPPKLLPTIKAGFDSVGAHLELLLFPILLDLFIWFGPHLNLRGWLEGYRSDFMRWFRGSLYSYDTIQASLDVWKVITEKLNIIAALRSYPVGIPSLMAGRLPTISPVGAVPSVDIPYLWAILAAWLALTLIGLALGTLYYTLVTQAILEGRLDWRQALKSWPGNALQVLVVSLALLFFVIVVSLPASCLLSFSAFAGLAASQCAAVLYTGFLLWLLFPWVFSAYGIFIRKDPALKSIQRGARITRLTIVSTSVLFFIVVGLTQGLDFLWNVTAESSWLSVIGIVGHAIVTTALLAATLIYYRDTDRWLESLLLQAAKTAA